MPPKRKAALKSKKADPIVSEDDMSRVTVRRPLKSNESGNLKDDQEVRNLQEDISETNLNMNATVILEKMPDESDKNQEFEENNKQVDLNKKSALKKNVITKVNKTESKKKTIEDSKVPKKTRKRAASEERFANKDEEKVVSSRSKKRPADKDSSEPSDSHSNELPKRNRRAASVDILTKNSSSVVLEPKKNRKANKGGTAVENIEILTKKNRRSSSLDSLSMNTSPVKEEPVAQKKNRKATKVVVETINDKQKKNTKAIKKKEPKTLGRNKKEDKNTTNEIIDEKENIDLLEQNNIDEKIEDKVKSPIALTEEQIDGDLEIENEVEKVPKQIKSRGKRQLVPKVVSKSKQNKSSEESSGKTDTDDSDVLKTPEKELHLESVKDSPEKISKQTKSKNHGKRQAAQKNIAKTNKASEESSGKSTTDDSDMAKTPEIKPKRIVKHKETNVEQEIKLPKRRYRKVTKAVDFEEDKILDCDENVETEDIPDNIPDTPEPEKNSVPPIVKRKAKAKPSKK